ncbi:DNA polymerase/3'-5' exonuclease PolX [Candidatus Daviesbacteria bacterium]|nr:DNA polymerase/3'-5' exonuclease PolX [Candidatus Daviesbacteria bacterium]
MNNQEIAKLLRSVATALTLKKASIFQIRAYETASDAIEHSTSEVRDLWQEKRLDEIPGVGVSLQAHLEELFKTGSVKHFEQLKKDFPKVVFELIDIPGVGPKTALELAKLGVKSFEDLKLKINSGELVKKGFSAKIAEKISLGLKETQNRTGRMLLPFADAKAQKIVDYLKKIPGVVAADSLGSLRRQVVTIGDLDFAAASKNPKQTIDQFVKMPEVKRIIDQGENRGTVILDSGLQIDLLVGQPDTYGALLQHFTGSKHHNIKLRSFAEKKNLSLSEYGVKNTKTNKVVPILKESELYEMLGMQTPPPEIREDNGEIEAALAHKLPSLVELKDIKGDFHLHSNFPMVHPSHGPGANSIEEIIKRAINLRYDYVGISDHPPGFRTTSEKELLSILHKRTKEIEQLKSSYQKSIRVLNGLEIDILSDGTLSVPNEVLANLDYSIAGVHSVHRMEKDKMTKRILKALENPEVDILAHPTGRLLNERDSYDVDWEVIFEFAAKKNKIMEINAFPNRLDLRDDLVRLALKFKAKFIVNTDAHEISQMENMKYGISVARRGWLESKDVVNSWDWKRVLKWFKIKKS